MQAPNPEADAPLVPGRVAIFTDFDGTLVEIAPTPDGVAPPPRLAEDLARLAAALNGALAIVTGRRIADIDHYLAPATLPVAGSHGAERRRVDGSLEPADDQLLTAAAEMARMLAPLALQHRGLLIEAKPATVALHYRQAPELAELCLTAATNLATRYSEFMVMKGKMVLELRPRRFGKGEAVRAFMAEAPFRGRLPIFLGDDATDEDAFVAVQALGGVGVKIGAGQSVARMRIPDVPRVRRFLGGIAALADQEPGAGAAT